MPKQEPSDGFSSIVPQHLLAQLHIPGRRMEILRADVDLAKLLLDVTFPATGYIATDPLFSGTLHFVRVLFTTPNGVVSVTAADIATAVNYATQASRPISKYAAQYGPNSVAIDQNVLDYGVNLTGTTYNDQTLMGWVNDILAKNNWPNSDCIVVLNPLAVVNTSGALSQGFYGYHGRANSPYIFVNVNGQNLTVSDVPFRYSGAVSHEMAEMIVDPLANFVNTEVCDPCGPNCISTYLPYFDNAGDYITTSQTPPYSVTFPFNFYINGIVKPDYGLEPDGSCPKTDIEFACNYGPIIRTDVAPAVAGVGNSIYLFQKSVDGRIFYNRAVLGQAGLGWAVMQGKGLISSAPSASAVGTHVFVSARGLDGGLYLNQADLDQAFGAWGPMIFNTDMAPAVAGVGNSVYFFAKHLDGRVFFNRAVLGQAGIGWAEVEGNGRITSAPAAGAVGTHVFVAARGLDGTLYLNQADLGQPFNDFWSPMGFVSDVSPAVTGVGNNVYFFAKHLDGRVFYNKAVLGQDGVGWAEVEGNGRLISAPAAGAVGTHVFVAGRGLDGQLYVNQADQGKPFSQWLTST